jgi:hypothetical protein
VSKTNYFLFGPRSTGDSKTPETDGRGPSFDRKKKTRFLLTGSSSRKLRRQGGIGWEDEQEKLHFFLLLGLNAVKNLI